MLTQIETKRLLVSRQDPVTRRFTRVGVLSCADDTFRFVYDDADERSLPGLPHGREHTSDRLFPVFAERVVHPLRADRDATLEQLGLPPEAGPFEILAVSGGRRTGDVYEVTPLPEPGDVVLPFLVHGIRHLDATEQAAVSRLTPGQPLALRPEPSNTHNPRALLVTSEGCRLGYVPDPLLDHVHAMAPDTRKVSVLRVNDPEAGFHMRLLVELRGLLSERTDERGS